MTAAPLWRVACPMESCAWRGYRRTPQARPCPSCGIAGDKIETLWQPGQGVPGPTRGYLLHFDWPGGRVDREHIQLAGGQIIRFHADHYLGKTTALGLRLRHHRAGRGAGVVAWAVALGASLRVGRVWDDDQWEAKHKQRSSRPSPQTRCGKRRGVSNGQARYCLICREERMELKLTSSRRRALEVLAAHPEVWRSNRTLDGPAHPKVYWLPGDWLVAQGWANLGGEYDDKLALTEAGRKVCAEQGIPIKEPS